MQKNKSKLKIAILLFVIFTLGIVFFFTSKLPQKIISDKIRQELTSAGIKNLRFEIMEIDFDTVVFKDFSAGNENDLKISKLTCSWSLESLLEQRLEKIAVEKAELFITVKNGEILNNIFTAQKGTGKGGLPFKIFTVDNLLLTADIEGVVKKQAISLSFEKQKNSSSSFSYKTKGGFGSVNGSGTVDNSFSSFKMETDITLTEKHTTGRLLGLGKTFLFSGKIRGEIYCDLRDFDSLQAEFSFKEASVKDKNYDFSLTGLSGRTILSGTEKPAAEFTFKELALGTLEFSNGKLSAQLLENKLFFKNAEIEIFGGDISVENFYVDPEKYSTSCEINCRNLDLEKVLFWALEGRLSGKGSVSGKLFVEIPQWPLLSLEKGGYLVSAGREQLLQLNDTKMVKGIITANKPEMQKTGNLLVDALQSFHYDELRLDIIEKDKVSTGRLFLSGRGLTGIKQPVGGLTINFLSFRKTLLTLILSNELYVKWQDKIENMTNTGG